ncbi:MAG TPA: chemotaxis protein CheB [Terracidiphilus sp.]|nr:chemotaxis protein CheB [Terracidiphilus sp.]
METKKLKNGKRRPSQAPQAEAGPIVVGIGASAGGLHALKHFFEKMPADTGLAFVVVVHLSPEHKSHLSDLLQPSVRFPVRQVTETTALLANNVYVIPPNANLSAIDTHLRLSKLESERRARAPIDHFFRTLASAHDGKSIGIILTGTGSDGTLGLKDIKAKGGLIIVQDPNEAEFDGMPQSAIATGLVDRVLPIAEIPDALVRFVRTDPQVRLLSDGKEGEENERILLPKVLAILKTRTERDFSRYKPATILRRIARRMQLNYIEEFNDYLSRLREDPDEARALADDLLITVTSFFRDPEVFEQLEKEVVPALFAGKGPKDSLRVWSVGCATGEEAYSLAMLLMEEAGRREDAPQIQVFASDLHKRSLDSAREGVFPGDIETDVSQGRLKRFFQKENGGYRIRKEIRDLVVFAPHNLLGDPPFSRIHLISCRNLLIYLDRSIQSDVIDLFHYALAPDGYLILGSSETVEASDLFRTEDKKLCIYRKRNVQGPEPRLPVFPLVHVRAGIGNVAKPEYFPGSLPFEAVHQTLLERYAPPSILVGHDDRLVHLSEHAGKYLVHPGGTLTSSVLKLVREELRIELRSLLQHARTKREPLDSRPIPVRFNGHAVPVVMHVRPAAATEEEGYVLVIFNEQPQLTIDAALAQTGIVLEPGQETERIAELEKELNGSHQRLQAMIEEYETSREEMKAANEELQSSNEELRSTMEELETSREELQSINEELQTVSQENRHKVEELTQLSNDLQNLMAATDIATLFLDRNLRILRFTPRVAELFNVRVTDRGRPISDLTHRLGYEQLRSDTESVLNRLVPIEREIEDDAGHWFLVRILPYRSLDDRIEGIVLTFTDISAQKSAERVLRSSSLELFREGTWLRTLLDSLTDAVIAADNEARVTYINPMAERLTGLLRAEAIGKPISAFYDVRTISGEPVQKSQIERAIAAGSLIKKDRFRVRSRSGNLTSVEESAAPILIGRKVEGAIAIIADIANQIAREATQEVERERLEGEVHKTTDQLGQTRAELRALSAYVINAQEEERRRLARELHDDFGQRVTVLGMRTNRAIEQLQKDPLEAEQIMRSISDEVSMLNLGLREASHRLHPSVLEDLDLVAALRSLISTFRDDGIDMTFRLPDDLPSLNADVSTAIYRIAQEALRNALKHASGAPVHITLDVLDSSVQLTVRDDGPGFDLGRIRLDGGLGILSMNERARLVNGSLVVESRPGNGTAVTVRMPIEVSH